MPKAPSSNTPAAPPAHRHRWARRLVAGVFILGTLRVALPFALAWAATSAGTRSLGTPVTIDNVDLDLIGGGIVVEGLAAAPWLRWERASLELAWRDLVRGRLRIGEIAIEGPQLYLTRHPDGRIEPLARLGMNPAEATPEPGPRGDLPDLRVESISVADGHLTLADAGGDTLPLEIPLEGLTLAGLASGAGGIELGAITLQTQAGPVEASLSAAGSPEEFGVIVRFYPRRDETQCVSFCSRALLKTFPSSST